MIRSFLTKVAQEYLSAAQQEFTSHPTANYLRAIAPKAFAEAVNAPARSLVVEGSAGQGQWTDVPWLAFLHEDETDSVRRGFYAIYLFSAIMDKVYLCFAQGVTDLENEFGRDAAVVLEQRNERARLRVPDHKAWFQSDRPNLNNKRRRIQNYESSVAFSKTYDLSALPSEEELLSDLLRMLELYENFLFDGGVDFVEDTVVENISPDAVTILDKKRRRMHSIVEGRANTDKVKKVLKYTCMGCGFNYTSKYGDLGKDFIEAHHLTPYSELKVGEKKVRNIKTDFAVLCANCHRMIHRTEAPHDLEAFKKLIKKEESNRA